MLIAWGGRTAAAAESVAHWALAFQLRELGLLIGQQDLIKRGPGFGVRGSQLSRQIADGGGGLFDSGGVVLLDGFVQRLVRALEAVVQRACGGRGIREYRGRLLLL